MMLYQIDLSGVLADTAITRFWESYGNDEPLDPAPAFVVEQSGVADDDLLEIDADVKAYAELLVRGVSDKRAELDEQIQKVSQHWRLERMANVDRNLLRLGAFELTALGHEVPRKVAINEAVEIAKRFGTAESSAFINGILDRLGR